MQSKATTVQEYLAGLPEERRAALDAVRAVVRQNLDGDIEECMSYGMIGYVVPHRVYPPGYHCDPKLPLPYAALASQKGYMSLYLGSMYCGASEDGSTGDGADARWLREQWARTGKKLDMGKSCIRFKKLDDLALDVIGEAIRRVPARVFIAHYEAGLGGRATAKKTTAKKTTAKKTTAKKTTAKKTTAKKATVRAR